MRDSEKLMVAFDITKSIDINFADFVTFLCIFRSSSSLISESLLTRVESFGLSMLSEVAVEKKNVSLMKKSNLHPFIAAEEN